MLVVPILEPDPNLLTVLRREVTEYHPENHLVRAENYFDPRSVETRIPAIRSDKIDVFEVFDFRKP